jgi:hypothetical protein
MDGKPLRKRKKVAMTKPSLREEIRKHLSDIYWFGYEKLGTEGEAVGDSVDLIISAVKSEAKKYKFPAHPYNPEDEKKRMRNSAIDDFIKGLEK